MVMTTKSCLIHELNQGKELVNQLTFCLTTFYPNVQVLIEKLRSSFDNALSMLNRGMVEAESRQMLSSPSATDSPPPPVSLRSDYSDDKDIQRKRKISPKSIELFRVSLKTGSEDPDDDGYSWRKYGQKNILGSKYARCYYQCTHRNSHKCLARKQVQRSDDSPSMFHVTYTEKHTCIQESHLIEALQSPQMEEQIHHNQQGTKRKKQSQHTRILNFNTNQLHKYQSSSSSFSSSTSPKECTVSESNIFSSLGLENNSTDDVSPSLPSTSQSNCFSPFNTNGIGESGLIYQNMESAAANFLSNSPIHDFDSAIEQTEFYWRPPNSPIQDFDYAIEQIEFDWRFFVDSPQLFN